MNGLCEGAQTDLSLDAGNHRYATSQKPLTSLQIKKRFLIFVKVIE